MVPDNKNPKALKSNADVNMAAPFRLQALANSAEGNVLNRIGLKSHKLAQAERGPSSRNSRFIRFVQKRAMN